MVMEQIPDHPVIQSMERTGHPPGRVIPSPSGGRWLSPSHARRKTDEGERDESFSLTCRLRAAPSPAGGGRGGEVPHGE